MRTPIPVALATVTSVLIVLGPAAPAPSYQGSGSGEPSGPCESLLSLTLPDTVITSAAVDPGSATMPASCRVHATVTHPPAGDTVNIDVWLPVDTWNGRFMGVGGGVYFGGSPQSLAGPVRQGFAAGVTDGGHPGGNGDFALDPDGGLNWPLIRDFGYLAVHDMTVVGKAVTAAFYDRPARYAYWTGCSTGGRQGLAEAQRYPDDYDGILAAAPAINWSRFIPTELWPQVVMLNEGNVLPQCKFAAFQAAAVEACDEVGDRVTDGVIGDPSRCDFDPRKQIGTVTPCGTITARDASVVQRILDGPRTSAGEFQWYGLPPGATFGALARTTTTDGVTTGAPFPVPLTHIGIWLLQDPSWDWQTTTYRGFEQLFIQSDEQYTAVIGTDDPDLRAFRSSGGKLLIWHGQVDQLIFPQGTVDYYDRVMDVIGSQRRTERFARLFLAPGVAHCAGGPGPNPDATLDALIDWVERGKAPRTLDGVVRAEDGTVLQTRPICSYPEVAAYQGRGDPMEASSFRCRPPKRH